MNIILIGLRGSGKTKIGKTLHKLLKWPLVDIDEEVEKKEKKTIKEIVEKKGWDYFREVEQEIAMKAAEENDEAIIATGGGTIMTKDSLKALKGSGKIVYLYRKPKDCIKYIKDIKEDPNRPKLTDKGTIEEEFEEIYSRRNQTYCKSANFIFHRTDDVKEDAEELVSKLFEA